MSLPATAGWWDEAACRNADPDDFTADQSWPAAWRVEAWERAKATCRSCSVRPQCRVYIDDRETRCGMEVGVYDEQTPDERKARRRGIQLPLVAAVRERDPAKPRKTQPEDMTPERREAWQKVMRKDMSFALYREQFLGGNPERRTFPEEDEDAVTGEQGAPSGRDPAADASLSA